MKRFYCFELFPQASLDEAWEELEDHGFELAYGSEEEDKKIIYGYVGEGQTIPSLTFVQFYYPSDLGSIDWTAQWEAHGLNFQDGLLHIPLNMFSSCQAELLLEPGPGFGDLSHPTTNLVLSLMSHYAGNLECIDVGCGSGVLSLAAALMGVSQVYGIDIDPQAIEHSQANAKLNQLENKCHFFLNSDFKTVLNPPLLVVMNMIFSEQKEAYAALPVLHSVSGIWITSGIQQEERDAYIQQIKEWKGRLIDEREQEGWLSFVFEVN